MVSGTDFDVATGIQWAAGHGARVINMSLGGPDYSYALADAVDYAYGKNVLIIAAAGNDGLESILYPAALPRVMAVGATDKEDNRASFSNYGDTLDVVAPGVSIFSAGWDSSYVYAWNPLVDVNQDEKIGVIDLVYMARNYTKHGQ